MVSGLVTSPCDQLRIFSDDARLIRMESKSVIEVPRSNGLERYKVCPPAAFTPPRAAPSCFLLCLLSQLQAGSALELDDRQKFNQRQPQPACGRFQYS